MESNHNHNRHHRHDRHERHGHGHGHHRQHSHSHSREHSVSDTNGNSELDRPSERKKLDIREEVLTSLHKRENSRDNQFIDPTVTGPLDEANGLLRNSLLGMTLLQEPVIESNENIFMQAAGGVSVPASVQHREKQQNITWEYHNVHLTRIPGYGFGIAVSGGCDNPHFANGDPAIAISDVLKSGPAEGKLLVNDRILSANGITLENVDYATAVQVLRDSGPVVQLVIKRRCILLSSTDSIHNQAQQKITLNRINTLTKLKNLTWTDYGIVLGTKVYIKEVLNKNLSETLREGEVVAKVGGRDVSDMSLKDVKKVIQEVASGKGGDKLQIILKKDTSRTEREREASGYMNQQPQSNYILDSHRGNYSTQNLYVQQPTRQSQPPRTMDDDAPGSSVLSKNNLLRMQQQNGSRNFNGFPDGGTDTPPRPPPPLRELIDDVDEQQQAPLQQPSGSMSASRSVPPPPPPPPNSEYYSPARRQLVFGEDESGLRCINFIKKDNSLGIRLTGGNHVGIFVAAVQPGSPAAMQGLQPGDKIVKVNDLDWRLTRPTREEAVMHLLTLSPELNISLLTTYSPLEFASIETTPTDSFYIRPQFSYDAKDAISKQPEVGFSKGDVLHVTDTLVGGSVGQWQVDKVFLNPSNGEISVPPGGRGVIPNSTRANEIQLKLFNQEVKKGVDRGSFFRRKRLGQQGRSKSLTNGKDLTSWEKSASLDTSPLAGDLIYSTTSLKSQPRKLYSPYPRVTPQRLPYSRPVVIYGPLTSLINERLAREYPDVFTLIGGESLDGNKEQVVRLSKIREVISSGKHGLLELPPISVEKLQMQFGIYPIVIFVRGENKAQVKEVKAMMGGHTNGNSGTGSNRPQRSTSRSLLFQNLSTKKLLEECTKMEKSYGPYLFHALVSLSDRSWQRKLREAIDKEQSHFIWVTTNAADQSTTKTPKKTAADANGNPSSQEEDYMFPASMVIPSGTPTRHSYASSPDDEDDEHRMNNGHDHSMHGTNTNSLRKKGQGHNHDLKDPQIQLPNYNAPPPYSVTQSYNQDTSFAIPLPPGPTMVPPSQPLPMRRPSTPTSNGSPSKSYKKMTPSEEKYNRSPNNLLQSPLAHSPPDSPSGNNVMSPRRTKVDPPMIDRTKKPRSSPYLKPPSAKERLFGDIQGNYMNSRSFTNGQYQHPQSSSSSMDMDKHSSDYQGSISEALPPYNLGTRPTPSGNSGYNQSPKSSPYRPVPPPKNNYGYKPVPPPKPAKPLLQYNRSQDIIDNSSYYDNNNVFTYEQSGFAKNVPTNQSRTGYYLNVPVPQQQKLDMSRSSAFELYRKPKEPSGGAVVAKGEGSARRVLLTERGIFNEQGGILATDVAGFEGLQMYVPPGAFPPGTTQELYIQVIQQEPNALPLADGESLLTPLIQCGPEGTQFLIPVEIRIPPHLINQQTNSKHQKVLLGSNRAWTEVDIKTDSQDVGPIHERGAFLSLTLHHF